MNTKIDSITKTKIKFDKIAIAFLACFLFVGVVFFLVQTFQKQNLETKNEELQKKEYRNIENNSEFSISKYNVKLPAGWSVVGNYVVPSSEILTCRYSSGLTSNSTCNVYEVSDDSANFYFSSSLPMLEFYLGNPIISTEKATVSNIEREITSYSLNLVSRTDESEGGTDQVLDSKLIKQAFLCIDLDFCISTGSLSLDISQNEKDYAKFKDLLQKINIVNKTL